MRDIPFVIIVINISEIFVVGTNEQIGNTMSIQSSGDVSFRKT